MLAINEMLWVTLYIVCANAALQYFVNASNMVESQYGFLAKKVKHHAIIPEATDSRAAMVSSLDLGMPNINKSS